MATSSRRAGAADAEDVDAVEALRNAGAVDDEQDGHFRMVIGA